MTRLFFRGSLGHAWRRLLRAISADHARERTGNKSTNNPEDLDSRTSLLNYYSLAQSSENYTRHVSKTILITWQSMSMAAFSRKAAPSILLVGMSGQKQPGRRSSPDLTIPDCYS